MKDMLFWAFQSLIGILQTKLPEVKLPSIPEVFQSLIGILQTFTPCVLDTKFCRFQSLIGILQTVVLLKNRFQ